jgi:hypothetical protein
VPGAISQAMITYTALLIAAFKVRVIIVEFMAACHTPKTVQHVMDAWLSCSWSG